MGRPVTKHARLKISSATTSTLQEFYPSATTTWRSTVVTTYKYQWVTEPTPNTSIVWRMQVNTNDVLEFSTARTNLETTCLVIPWLGGLQFTNGEKVGWVVTLSSQNWVSSTFFGAEA